MITLTITSDGYKHFRESILEYQKRLGKSVTLKVLKPVSHTNPEYIKVKETLELIESLKKEKWVIILLDERGKTKTTLEFAERIQTAKNTGEKLHLIIGGSYGVDLELFRDIPHEKLSLGSFVMPHSLALLVLLEQIYRASEIERGSGYHHS